MPIKVNCVSHTFSDLARKNFRSGFCLQGCELLQRIKRWTNEVNSDNCSLGLFVIIWVVGPKPLGSKVAGSYRAKLREQKRDNFLLLKKLSLGLHSGGAFRTYDHPVLGSLWHMNG